MVSITDNTLLQLTDRVEKILALFDYKGRCRAFAIAEKEPNAPGFWASPERAEGFLYRLKEERKELKALATLKGALEELGLAFEFWKCGAIEEAKVNDAHNVLLGLLASFEIKEMMQGKNDRAGAIIDIHPGAGGVESQDWAAMLLRMYTLWGAQKGHKVTTLYYQPAEEAGIKSATIKLEGAYLYGLLQGETGVHRLVRLSPFNASHKRQTSFASVRVLPAIENKIAIEVNPEDLLWQTFRSGGAGGQHVNKVETGVRVKHIPTGIVANCQEGRSQLQNKNKALSLLKLLLLQEEEKKRAQAKEAMLKTQKGIDFSSQIRNYVLHPYKMVKDRRSAYEEHNVDKVLGGALDDMLKEYLIWKKKDK